MLTIAADPEHLGARIGITSVLHTWGIGNDASPARAHDRARWWVIARRHELGVLPPTLLPPGDKFSRACFADYSCKNWSPLTKQASSIFSANMAALAERKASPTYLTPLYRSTGTST